MTFPDRSGPPIRQFEAVHCGGTDWDVDPRLADQLLGPAGLRWDQWQERGWLETVRGSRFRPVYRVTLPAGVYYVRHFRAADRWARWRRRFRGAVARREWQAAARVKQLGVPTLEVVAVGGPRGRGQDADSLLVSRAIPDARPLDQLISSGTVSRIARREILSKVAEIVARLHDGGVWHADLHAANFLVRFDADDQVAIWLNDLRRVHYRRPTTRLRMRQLGQLAAALGPGITRSDHLVFLRHYLSTSRSGNSDRESFRTILTRLQGVYQSCCASVWKRLDRQWARGNRRLLIADAPGIRCRGLSALGRQQLEHLRNRLAANPPPDGTRLPLATGHGPVATIVHRLDPQGDCSAHEAWELGHALKRRGLPVAAPWLYVETPERSMLAIMVPDTVVPLSESSSSERAEQNAQRILRQVDAMGLATETIRSSHLLLDRKNRAQPLFLLPTWRGWNRRPVRRMASAITMRLLAFSLPWLLTGCLSLHTVQETFTRTFSRTAVSVDPPARHSVRSKRFTVLSDVPLQRNHWLIQDLEQLERQLVESLGLSESGREVTVYVFAHRRDYETFLKTSFPQLPTRRAYFVGTPQQLSVYTFWGDKIQEDLRHEFTHGILHSSLAHVPLWLDEGLAEYFEVVGRVPGGINAEYADRLAASVANGWQPDLERLERLEAVGEMQRVDYEQAWAWIHFLMHGTPEGRAVLRDQLQSLVDQPRAEPLSSRIRRQIPQAEAGLLDYIRQRLAGYRRPVSR